VFSNIFDLKNAWHFLQFLIQKIPNGRQAFLAFLIQKMFGGYHAFSMIFDPENTWQLLGVFMDFGFRKPLVVTRHFLQFLIQEMLGNRKTFSWTLDSKNPWRLPFVF
jgi:hypothetical protein